MSVRFNRAGETATNDHNDLINKGQRTHAVIDSYLTEIDEARGDKASLAEKLSIKKTAVFYIKQITQENHTVSLYIPYKGTLKTMYVSFPKPFDIDLVVVLLKGGGTLETITVPVGATFAQASLTGSLDFESLQVNANGSLGSADISICVDFMLD
ncbi:hypothetical protein SAMN05446037_100665 [Anaerovirgula multivorans]|uniref:Uncharacterized protein n=1 Tax=Anaerovirgula multivorans TaxID=312168 RepID=A0A239CN79_9FIRM|nr:hypothetical protein [Anaerovirgula multivorans]SNS21625.1 hypothetical protein SAMN05446037_100665 [Anaerovirgula multivorans]